MRLLMILLTVSFLGACAHHRDVRPGASGINRVVVVAEDEREGARDALSQANHFCGERKLSAAIVEEKTTYTGSMDKDTYMKTKTGARIAKTVGGTAWVFGGKNESNLGGIAHLNGQAADAAAGEGFTTDMTFKCQ